MDEVRIYPSRIKLGSFAVTGAVVSALGAFVALAQPIGPVIPTVARAVGWIALTMFGTVTLWLVFRLVRHRPLLVLSRDGVLDRSSAVGAGFVAWTEIEEVRLSGARPHRFLAVIPKDPGGFISARPWVRRVVFKMNRVFGFPVVAVPAAWFPMRLEEVLARIGQVNPEVVRRLPAGDAPGVE